VPIPIDIACPRERTAEPVPAGSSRELPEHVAIGTGEDRGRRGRLIFLAVAPRALGEADQHVSLPIRIDIASARDRISEVKLPRSALQAQEPAQVLARVDLHERWLTPLLLAGEREVGPAVAVDVPHLGEPRVQPPQARGILDARQLMAVGEREDDEARHARKIRGEMAALRRQVPREDGQLGNAVAVEVVEAGELASQPQSEGLPVDGQQAPSIPAGGDVPSTQGAARRSAPAGSEVHEPIAVHVAHGAGFDPQPALVRLADHAKEGDRARGRHHPHASALAVARRRRDKELPDPVPVEVLQGLQDCPEQVATRLGQDLLSLGLAAGRASDQAEQRQAADDAGFPFHAAPVALLLGT